MGRGGPCRHRRLPAARLAASCHPAMGAAARLADELRAAGDPNMADVLGAGFVIASNYRVHFYHRDTNQNEGSGWFFTTAKESVEQFVERMAAISDSLDSQ